MQQKTEAQYETDLTRQLVYSLVKNPITAKYFPCPGEENTSPSLTIPDQAMSLKEILRRFAAGIPIDAGKVPLYEEYDELLPDLTYMDLADREEAINRVKSELEAFKASQKQNQGTPIPPTPSGPNGPQNGQQGHSGD